MVIIELKNEKSFPEKNLKPNWTLMEIEWQTRTRVYRKNNTLVVYGKQKYLHKASDLIHKKMLQKHYS